VGDLARLEQRVHRDDRAAGAQHAVVEDRELRHVRQHDADRVARPQAARAQPPGGPGAEVVELRVGQDRVVEPDGGAVRVHLRGLAQVKGQVGHDDHAPTGTAGDLFMVFRRREDLHSRADNAFPGSAVRTDNGDPERNRVSPARPD
jgi:hypothetical protein